MPAELPASSRTVPPSSGWSGPKAEPLARASRRSWEAIWPDSCAVHSCSASPAHSSWRSSCASLGVELVCAAQADVEEDEEAGEDPGHERRPLGDPDLQHPDDDVTPENESPDESREAGAEGWEAEMHRAETLTCALTRRWAGPKKFTERVALSSTSPTDLPLPRTAFRLGFDLHDGPLQELVALADDLRHARDQVASVLDDPHRSAVRGRFDDLEARLGSLDRGLRDIAHSVRATSAVEQPLEHALRNEVDALGRKGDVEAELAVDGDVASLTDSQKIALFRVVQESLCNIRKHSGATRASVRVRAVAGYVSLEVSDNGCGFSMEAAKSKGRLGLEGVVERVRLLGGDVEIESGPGQGVLVRATLPRWRPAVPSATPVYAATI